MTELAWFVLGVLTGWLMWVVAIWVTQPSVVLLKPRPEAEAVVEALTREEKPVGRLRVN